jgi:Thioredoxin.
MKIIRISAVWCPGCIVMKNAWNKINLENIEFIDLDYDINEEECKSYDIGTKLPVTIIKEDENEIGRIIGEKSEKELKNKLKEFGVIK